MTMAPLDDAARAAIRAAVDANFATQTAFLADFVRIPSLRFEEGPAQDFMAAALPMLCRCSAAAHPHRWPVYGPVCSEAVCTRNL